MPKCGSSARRVLPRELPRVNSLPYIVGALPPRIERPANGACGRCSQALRDPRSLADVLRSCSPPQADVITRTDEELRSEMVDMQAQVARWVTEQKHNADTVALKGVRVLETDKGAPNLPRLQHVLFYALAEPTGVALTFACIASLLHRKC
jgi:hypothetical protein